MRLWPQPPKESVGDFLAEAYPPKVIPQYVEQVTTSRGPVGPVPTVESTGESQACRFAPIARPSQTVIDGKAGWR